MTELKKCPFCEGEAEIRTLERFLFVDYYGVCCTRCHCSSPRYQKAFIDKAIEAWNRRAE